MELGIIILMGFFIIMMVIFIMQSYFIINVINKNKSIKENGKEIEIENYKKEPEQFFPPLRRKVYPIGLSTEQESELDFGVFSTY